MLIGELADVDDHPAGQPVVGRPDVCLPGGGPGRRPDRCEQHRRRVHGLGGYGSKPQAGDAPVIQVHRGSELGLHPAQCHRVHCEHVQPGGIQQQVLTRPHRPQPSVGSRRAPGDLPLGLRPAEGGRALADLPQQGTRPGPARHRHRSGAVLGVQPGRDPGQDQILSRRAGVGMLGQHRAGHRQPPGISAAFRGLIAQPPVINQAGRAALFQGGRPAADGAHPDLQFSGLGLVTPELADPGGVFRPRLTRQGKGRAAVAVAGACLEHMRDPLAEPGQFRAVQAGQDRPGVQAAVRSRGFAHAGARGGQQVADADPPQSACGPGEQDARRGQLGDLPPLPVVDHAGAGAQRCAHALIHPAPPARCHRQGGGEGQ